MEIGGYVGYIGIISGQMEVNMETEACNPEFFDMRGSLRAITSLLYICTVCTYIQHVNTNFTRLTLIHLTAARLHPEYGYLPRPW